MRADYEGIIREKGRAIKRLREERDAYSFSRKEITRQWMEVLEDEQEWLFRSLLDCPIMHVDGTVARVNGANNCVLVCSNGGATIYFVNESKGMPQ